MISSQRALIFDLIVELLKKPSFVKELQKRYPDFNWETKFKISNFTDKGVQTYILESILESVTRDIEHLNIDATIYYP